MTMSKKCYLYVMRSPYLTDVFKVGISIHPEKRADEVGANLLITVPFSSRSDARGYEAGLQRHLRLSGYLYLDSYHYHHWEWFHLPNSMQKVIAAIVTPNDIFSFCEQFPRPMKVPDNSYWRDFVPFMMNYWYTS